MNKESHLIKKSSSVNEAHQRPPVIIYTHSPKVIQMHAETSWNSFRISPDSIALATTPRTPTRPT